MHFLYLVYLSTHKLTILSWLFSSFLLFFPQFSWNSPLHKNKNFLQFHSFSSFTIEPPFQMAVDKHCCDGEHCACQMTNDMNMSDAQNLFEEDTTAIFDVLTPMYSISQWRAYAIIVSIRLLRTWKWLPRNASLFIMTRRTKVFFTQLSKSYLIDTRGQGQDRWYFQIYSRKRDLCIVLVHLLIS